jgi:superfamily II DNA/RNA helicase
MERPDHKIKALILVPTRELALQIDEQVMGIGYSTNLASIPVYGGGSGEEFERQKKALTSGVDVVVATPGKLISHLQMGYADFSNLSHLVLDEADRMLDIGFHDDIIKIISYLPKQRQTLMFSATMPPKIRSLTKKILKNPVEISIAISKPVEGVLQVSYLTHDDQKIELIHQLLADKPDYKSIIVFCSTRKKVNEIVRSLKQKRFNVEGISSDWEQSQREEIMNNFRSKQIRVLIATDVISRGIDIKDINLIVNYDVPRDPEDYVHRIGRTARAEKTGVAITFINSHDMLAFHNIEKLIEREIIKLQPPAPMKKGPLWSVERRKYSKRSNFSRKPRPKRR